MKNIIIAIIFIILTSCGVTEKIPNPITDSKITGLTESEAKIIAEKNCIKGGEALGTGSYNETTKTWWFDANLNATKPGCNPACVVFEDTKKTEINWRCTGLVIKVEEQKNEIIKKLFIEKYPKFSDTMSLDIRLETDNHARGNISFEEGAPGGIFLATKINGKWQIVHDGNGEILCELSKYGFPESFLTDCSEK